MKKNITNTAIDIGIITNAPFPQGVAATNRIISYVKALIHRDVGVKVYITKPTEKSGNIINRNTEGFFEAIEYEYLSDSTIWPQNKSKIFKLGVLIKGYIKLIVKVINERPGIIITYTKDFTTKLLLIVLKRILNFNLFFEETEYPNILSKKTNKFYKKLYLKLYKWADGMIVMTNELSDYYSKLGVMNLFNLPMTVDSSRFSESSHLITPKKYFIYVGGNGGFVRDGVFNIIQGFGLICNSYPDYRLYIVGAIEKSASNFLIINNYIKEQNMTDKVLFLGSKLPEEIPLLLMQAKGIIMAPPADFPSGGFPTKLGEFLASGRPVICTKVSEIPLYLNSDNSFLVNPKDINGIRDAVEYIIDNPENSNKVGLNGKHLAETTFNPETYINKLLNFLNL